MASRAFTGIVLCYNHCCVIARYFSVAIGGNIVVSSKWHHYTEALTQVLGCNTSLLEDTLWSYRLLLLPTFHSISCLSVCGTTTGGAIGFTVLQDTVGDLFEAIGKQDASQIANPYLWRQRHCLADLAILSAAECQAIMAHMHTIQPWLLPEADLASRDGIAIRLDCVEQQYQHTVYMTSPTRIEAPQHHAVLSLMLRLGQTHFVATPLQQYFATIHIYLPDIGLAPSIP